MHLKTEGLPPAQRPVHVLNLDQSASGVNQRLAGYDGIKTGSGPRGPLLKTTDLEAAKRVSVFKRMTDTQL